MRIVFTLLCLSLALNLNAQLYTFQLDWKSIVEPYSFTFAGNSEASCIAEIPGQGFVWAGFKIDNFASTDIWVQKIDYNGNAIWDTIFGGDNYDYAFQIRALKDNSFIVLGTSASSNISNDWLYSDVILVKYKNDGQLEWWQRYGNNQEEHPTDIRVCQDGGFVVTGLISRMNQNGNFTNDAWVFKTDSLGNVIWDRQYIGTGDDIAQSVVQTADGGFAVAISSTSSNGDFEINNNEVDSWLFKLDKNGTIEWKEHYGGIQAEIWQHIEMTPDSGFIISGVIESGSDLVEKTYGGATDVWVCRVAALGDLLWSKNFGGSKWDVINDMSHANSNYYWHSGLTMSNDHDLCRNNGKGDLWVFAVDLDGNLVWSETYGGSESDDGIGIYSLPEGFIACGAAISKDGDVGPHEPYRSGWFLKINYPETFNISFSPTDTLLCESDYKSIEVNIPDSIEVSWNTNQKGHEIEIHTEGIYIAEASLFGCTSSDSIYITVVKRPELPRDSVHCFGDSILLIPSLTPDYILWNSTSEEPYIWANSTGTYIAEMHINSCIFIDSVNIVTNWCVENSNCLDFPNLFTPNDDGVNDFFGPIDNCDITPDRIGLQIYSRWGNKIFESNNGTWPTWDGKDFPSDVYAWKCIITYKVNDSLVRIQKRGDVTLVR